MVSEIQVSRIVIIFNYRMGMPVYYIPPSIKSRLKAKAKAQAQAQAKSKGKK
jgi:hypothetical protein